MSHENRRIAACLCGAVRMFANIARVDMGACHCRFCQTWAGGPLFEVECGSDVEFQGLENVAIYESSTGAHRGFCKTCGTHLFVKSVLDSEYGIPPGLFQNREGISFNRQVFIDHKPDYYSFSNDTHDISSEYIYEHHPETKGYT